MAAIDVSVSKELLPGLLGGQDGLAKLVETVLNQILQAQVTQALGAQRHERSEDRTGYRNGHRPRTLYTRVGPVTLLVPQTRDGSFSTDIFKRYQRSEQAFVLALMEMVVQGVSTRKVAAITEELCGASFSKSTVSSLCAGLDARVRAFNERRLEGEYPFVLVDAMFIQSRQEDRVLLRTVLIVSGVRSDGYREILGVKIGSGFRGCHGGHGAAGEVSEAAAHDQHAGATQRGNPSPRARHPHLSERRVSPALDWRLAGRAERNLVGEKVSGHAGVSRMGGCLRRRPRGQQRCYPLGLKPNRH